MLSCKNCNLRKLYENALLAEIQNDIKSKKKRSEMKAFNFKSDRHLQKTIYLSRVQPLRIPLQTKQQFHKDLQP